MTYKGCTHTVRSHSFRLSHRGMGFESRPLLSLLPCPRTRTLIHIHTNTRIHTLTYVRTHIHTHSHTTLHPRLSLSELFTYDPSGLSQDSPVLSKYLLHWEWRNSSIFVGLRSPTRKIPESCGRSSCPLTDGKYTPGPKRFSLLIRCIYHYVSLSIIYEQAT